MSKIRNWLKEFFNPEDDMAMKIVKLWYWKFEELGTFGFEEFLLQEKLPTDNYNKAFLIFMERIEALPRTERLLHPNELVRKIAKEKEEK